MFRNVHASVALLAGAALLCSGCAFRRQVTGMAMEHNEFVAQATNRQTVLNILRAREREPMHFTSFASVSGRVQGTGQLGLNTVLNGDSSSVTRTDTTVTKTGADGGLSTDVTDTLTNTGNFGAANWTPSAQVQVVTGTDFSIGVNATQEFYRGVIAPLSPGIIIHYLRQGFPRDLLSHLLIRRMEFYARIKAPDGTQEMVLLRAFNNTPDQDPASREFADAVRCRQLDYRVTQVAASSLQVPVTNLAGIAPDILARLRAVEGPGETTIYLLDTPARNEFSLRLSTPDQVQCRPSIDELREQVREWAAERRLLPREGAADGSATALPPSDRWTLGEGLTLTSSTSAAQEEPGVSLTQGIAGAGITFTSETVRFDDLLPAGYEGVLVVDVTIRSVEGVLYYLGEYTRNESTSPLLWDRRPGGCGYCIPIIRVRPANQLGTGNRFVNVSYRGRSYAVPMAGAELNRESGRSSQVIGLVQQLLNLHRSANELPSTQLVRIVN